MSASSAAFVIPTDYCTYPVGGSLIQPEVGKSCCTQEFQPTAIPYKWTGKDYLTFQFGGRHNFKDGENPFWDMLQGVCSFMEQVEIWDPRKGFFYVWDKSYRGDEDFPTPWGNNVTFALQFNSDLRFDPEAKGNDDKKCACFDSKKVTIHLLRLVKSIMISGRTTGAQIPSSKPSNRLVSIQNQSSTQPLTSDRYLAQR